MALLGSSKFDGTNVSETKKDPIAILIVEDHPIFLLGLSSRISSMGENFRVVGEARDGTQAQKLASTLHPDIILMDIHLPAISGIEATRNIKAEFPEIQVIILSADDQMKNINDALLAGAAGYLLKSVSEGDLAKAINAVMNGDSAFSPGVAQRLLTILRKPSIGITDLSKREIQILEHVAEGATNKKISEEMFLSVRTVETHVHHIFEKLGVTTRTEAVMAAIRKGLI